MSDERYVLVPVGHLESLADLRKRIHQHDPDRVKWEGEWHYGPLATAYIATIEGVADAARTMLSAAPPPDDAVIERVARSICKARGWNPDTCLYGSSGLSSDGTATSTCHAWMWQNCIPDATAAIAALCGGRVDG